MHGSLRVKIIGETRDHGNRLLIHWKTMTFHFRVSKMFVGGRILQYFKGKESKMRGFKNFIR